MIVRPRHVALLLGLALCACSRDGVPTVDPHGAVPSATVGAGPAATARPVTPAAPPLPAEAILREVGSPLDGRVVRVVAAAGTDVIAGEPLAWISSPVFDDAVARLRAANEEEAAARTRAEAARAAAAKSPPTAGASEPPPLPEETAHRAAQDRREALALQLRALLPSGRVGDDTSLFAIRAPEPGRVVATSAAPGNPVRIDGGALFTIAVARPARTAAAERPASAAPASTPTAR